MNDEISAAHPDPDGPIVRGWGGGITWLDTWMMPYLPLPGTQLGPHDWVEFIGDREVITKRGLPLLEGVTWWHHADSSPGGKRPKGGRCGGGSLGEHDLVEGTATPDDLSRISIKPSLLCGACGRHIFITDGKVKDLGNAHMDRGTE